MFDRLNNFVKIALCQLLCEEYNVESNVEKVKKAVNENTADVYLFAESFLIGDRMNASDYSLEPTILKAIDELQKFAAEKDVVISIGGPRYQKRKIFNTMYLIDKKGISFYDKIYLNKYGLFSENELFSSGDKLVFYEKDWMKVGISEGYDIYYPGVSRYHTYLGANVLLYSLGVTYTVRGQIDILLPARAIENATYVIFMNRVGPAKNNTAYYGTSRIYDPYGNIVCQLPEKNESVLVFELNPENVDPNNIARQSVKVGDKCTKLLIESYKKAFN